MYKNYRKGIFCVVYYRKEFLLLHRKLHWKGWEFPKGGIKRGESKEKAALREVKEETGLDVLKLRKFPVKGRFTYDKRTQASRKARGATYVLFSALVEKNKVRLCRKEHDGFRWCSAEEALGLLTWPNQRHCLEIVAKSLGIRK